MENAPVRTEAGTDRLIQLAIFARDFDRASALLVTLPPNKEYSMPWEGILARMRGDQEKVREYYTSAIDRHQNALAQRADDIDALTGLSFAYAAVGRKQEAIHEARRAVELVPLSRNAIEAPRQILVLAEVYAQLGERDAALEQLASIVQLPGGPDYGGLKFDPVWDDLRTDSRFQEILARAAQPPIWN